MHYFNKNNIYKLKNIMLSYISIRITLFLDGIRGELNYKHILVFAGRNMFYSQVIT